MKRQPPLYCLLMVSVVVSSVGCAFDDKGLTSSGSGNHGGGNTLTDASIGSDRGTITGSTDTGGLSEDANCGLVKSSLASVPADLLIVLDRSGSMDQDAAGMSCIGGCGALSKWSQMTTAINQTVMQTETKVNWGLKLFGSTNNGCAVTAGVEVAPATMNAAPIRTTIAATMTGSSTPTRAGVAAASTYLTGLADGNAKYIVLATDGLPNCGVGRGGGGGGNNNAADDAASIQAVMTSAAAGVPVFVIGIATNGTADTTLNAMAVAGGRPQVGAAQQYYSVNNTADLVTVLDTLQGMVAHGCTYRLPRVPPNPSNVKVTVEGVKVNQDTSHTTGWDYSPDMLSIIFYGQQCTSLMAGTTGNVSIILGCGTTPIP